MGVRPPVIGMVGASGSGKTWLIEFLVVTLTREGRRVGTLKHHPEPLETDRPGSDTHLHRAAGSLATWLLTPGLSTLWMAEAEPVEAVRRLMLAFPELDLILVEGWKEAPWPRLLVRRPNDPDFGLADLAAVYGEPPPGWDGPVFQAPEEVLCWLRSHLAEGRE